DKAICDFWSTNLAYQDGTTLNLKKHNKKHKNKVPELKKLNIKQGGISVINILNNKTGIYF
ncbi:13047_t:CDS:1, partial [Gigaspora margarita]